MWKHALRCASVAWLAAIAPGAAVAASLWQDPAVHTATQSAAIERFARQIATDVKQDDVGAITAGVFIGSEIVWAQGFGWADRDRHIAADANTIYRVGSISKSFTALLMAQLAARKRARHRQTADRLPTGGPEARGRRGHPGGCDAETTGQPHGRSDSGNRSCREPRPVRSPYGRTRSSHRYQPPLFSLGPANGTRTPISDSGCLDWRSPARPVDRLWIS